MEKEQELPSGWTVAKLKDIADWSSGGTPKATVPEYYGGDIPWLIIGDLNDGYVYKSASSLTTLGLKESSAKMVKPYSVLVAMYGSIGKLGINRIPVATNQAIAFTEKLYEIVTNRYLFFYLLFVRPQLLGLGQGGTQKNISQTILKEVFISLPPLPEQHRIIAKIEELFSELDKGVESLKTAQEQLKIYRQSVLQRAFEGKLTKNENRNMSLVRLEEVCDFITKGTTPAKKDLFQGSGDVPFIKVYNLTFRGHLDFAIDPTFVSRTTHNTVLARSKVLPGDVLMNIVGPPLGKVAIVPNRFPEWNINQAIARFRCKKVLFNKFLTHYLMSSTTVEKIKSKSKATAGQFNLTLEICRDIELLLPSLSDQHQIVAEIESRLSVCDKLEESIAQSLLQAEALRQSILKKAFAGKLVSQDPQDEPAEKLLARIRAERAQAQPTQKVAKGRKKQ